MSTHTIWTVKKIKALGVTTDVPTAANVLGISRANAYELARHDAFPVPIIRIGARVLVPVAGLLRLLLIIPELSAPETFGERLDHAADPSVHGPRPADSGSTPGADHPSNRHERDAFDSQNGTP